MKIALLNPTFLMRRPIAELARLLAGRGHEITVIWPMDREQSQTNQRHFDKLLKDAEGITVLPIWSKEIKAILWSVPADSKVLSKLREVGKTHDVVMVWAPFYPLPLLPFIMKRLGLFKAKLVGVYDTIPSFSFSMGRITDILFKIFFGLLTKPVLEAADRTAIYSKLLVLHARKAGFSARKLVILPTGVDVKVKRAEKDVREELKMEKDEAIVLFIGLINKRKGVYRVLDVAEKLKAKDLKFKLVMIGKGPEEDSVKAQIEERKLGSVVTMLGHRQDVHDFYHAAECFFLPADGEGLPGVVMEAMSYGRVVVASDIPCIPDLIESGESGFLHAPNDTDAFAESIAQVLTDPELRGRFEQRALADIAEWSWSKRVPLYEQLFAELTGTGK